MPLSRRPVCLLPTLLLGVLTALAHAQAYTSIVVFGDSLSDVGNVAHLTQAKYGPVGRVPGPLVDYTDGRFTDGTDTIPAAQSYTGVWIEQLAASLPAKPVIKNSLDGGTDYAYGFATTADGTAPFTYGPQNTLSVNVNNIGQQITDYLSTNPTISNTTLFVVWGGAIDLLHATSADAPTTSATQEVADIQRLIAAGATEFLIPNLPPLGAIPRLNGSPTTSTPATAESVAFNTALQTGIATLPGANTGKTLHLFQLDVFTLFSNAIASPSTFSFANVTGSSQGHTTVNPDTYLFWDDLHPTTAAHHQIALDAGTLITPTLLSSLSPTSITVPRGGTGTSTVTLTPAGGYSGTVTLACGTLPAHLSCSFAPATATFTGNNVVQTSVLTIGTTASAELRFPSSPGSSGAPEIFSALAAFPGLGFVAFAALRRRQSGQRIPLLILFAMLSATATLALTGCGGSDNKAKAGSYTVAVKVTGSDGTSSTLNLAVVVQ